ncbi:MAG TPA: glycosyltransferase family 39 protein [Gemmatimonadaceae bacterium]|nr:glycosyltransferase family 39 protein [Gemmatimonadaceae bacterium]
MAERSDAREPAGTWWVLAGLAAAVVALKIPTLGTPGFWDELGWLDQARWLSENNLLRVIPGLRPPARFWGHPPGLHLTLAIPWKLFGASLPIARGLLAAYAAVGVCATFLLARHFYDTRRALFAAALLALSPAFLAPAGMFLSDMPVTSLAVLSVYLACRNRYLAYLLCASYMVVVKETAMAIIAAIVVYRFIDGGWRLTRDAVRDALRYTAPLAVIGAFATYQKFITGHFFFLFDFEFDALMVRNVPTIVDHVADITRWVFVDQLRWLMTAAIALNLLINPSARMRHLWLFALIVVMSGYSFAVLYYMPRYVLPVLPFLYIAGAAAVLDLARTRARQVAASGIAVALSVWVLVRDPHRRNGEDNFQYLRTIRIHRAMAAHVAQSYPSARILTSWPVAAEFADPLFGYVDRPLRVTWFNREKGVGDAELIVISEPSNAQAGELRALAAAAGWRVIRRESTANAQIELFGPPSAK